MSDHQSPDLLMSRETNARLRTELMFTQEALYNACAELAERTGHFKSAEELYREFMEGA